MSRLKMAKAENEEFELTMGFVRVMEALFDDRPFFCREEDWRDWPDEDEDKKRLLEIEKEVIDEDGTCWDGKPDNRLVLYEFIKRKWRAANFYGSFGRIIMDAEVLIDNACDPDLDYLEFKPEILAAMKEYEEKKEPVSEDIEEEIERFAYSLPHSASGFWPKDIDCKSVEARTKYGVSHEWSYEQVMNIARHFLQMKGDRK